MKLLVVSDSHGLTDELIHLREEWEGKVDAMVHCGDSQLSSKSKYLQGYQVVRGNCDFYNDMPEDIELEIGKFKVFVTHGHLYDCKMTMQRLFFRAKELDAQFVLFGHSHIRGVEETEDVIFLNPGSIRMPRMFREKTYAILEANEDETIVTFYDLHHKIVDQCRFVMNY